jgi:hypothetical protein
MSDHIWTDDALSRLLGARDGYIHSLLAVRGMIQRFDSAYTGRFHPRHTRKIERRDAITKPLREVANQIEADMRRCKEVYKREYARAHPASTLSLHVRSEEQP